jgi:predicted nucleic acid-binding protein
MGLEAVVRQAAYQRLRAFRGSEPNAQDVPRRREKPSSPNRRMILVDTSVWIRFFSNQALYGDLLDTLLDRGEVAGHELIYGELLVSNQELGDRGGRTKFLAIYEKLHQSSMIPHSEVVSFVRDRKLDGRGLGWFHVHLPASAIVERSQLWTADNSFAAVARELGVASEKSSS